MPVEIRELVVKAIVPTPTTEDDKQTPDYAENEDTSQLVQRCVAEVLKILEKKARR